jgi:hypothetical protein
LSYPVAAGEADHFLSREYFAVAGHTRHLAHHALDSLTQKLAHGEDHLDPGKPAAGGLARLRTFSSRIPPITDTRVADRILRYRANERCKTQNPF